jgi:hypothetical protein
MHLTRLQPNKKTETTRTSRNIKCTSEVQKNVG